ncbi:MAG TPA: hypothetical protein VGD67_08210 [Pseudonocardiaceae bacterium]
MNEISREQMAELITNGTATPWTHPLGVEGDIPTAATLADTWYVVLDGHDHYTPAAADLAAVLTSAHCALAAADAAIGAQHVE